MMSCLLKLIDLAGSRMSSDPNRTLVEESAAGLSQDLGAMSHEALGRLCRDTLAGTKAS